MFFKNICRFNQCGLEFATLYDLIQHIEEIHIVNDAEHQKQFELLQRHGQQQAPIVPLSYICRHFQKMPDRKPKIVVPEQNTLSANGNTLIGLQKKRPSVASVNFANRLGGTPPVVQVNFQPPNTPSVASSSAVSAGSEIDDDNGSVDNESLSSDSTVVDDNAGDQNFSNNRFLTPANVEERKYACPVAGCKKKYKNINGVRYHAKIAHGGEQNHNVKAYKCTMCSKGYKTSHGLQNHQAQANHKPIASTSSALNITAASAQANMQMKQQHQHAFPLTLLTSSASGANSNTVRVSPAPSPSLILAAQQQPAGIKLTSSVMTSSTQFAPTHGVMPSGVSIQVQPAMGSVNFGGGPSATTTTVHVPQQGAAATPPGGGGMFNVSLLGARSTYSAAATAAAAAATSGGIKRSNSYAQLVGSAAAAAGRPLKMSHNLIGQRASVGGPQYLHMVAAQQQHVGPGGVDHSQMPVISTTIAGSSVGQMISKQ